jgi:uncharacterized protein with von Willebrand factor type A (vWA) domain
MENYTLKYGPITEASTITTITLGAKIICNPINSKWKAYVKNISGYEVEGDTYKESMKKCIDNFQKDISRIVETGGTLPLGLTADWRTYFED